GGGVTGRVRVHEVAPHTDHLDQAVGLGLRGGHGDDESDGRLTWLTEDEMVWGDGDAAPPPVLGGN
ncbi:hypothetical protein, partial [Micromonospora tulbaghiae]|uniref:hypothetical protein n=1 Tax=Micromonospora tulbaghiae TaxID=479978 RepID=UPI0033C50C73